MVIGKYLSRNPIAVKVYWLEKKAKAEKLYHNFAIKVRSRKMALIKVAAERVCNEKDGTKMGRTEY